MKDFTVSKYKKCQIVDNLCFVCDVISILISKNVCMFIDAFNLRINKMMAIRYTCVRFINMVVLRLEKISLQLIQYGAQYPAT